MTSTTITIVTTTTTTTTATSSQMLTTTISDRFEISEMSTMAMNETITKYGHFYNEMHTTPPVPPPIIQSQSLPPAESLIKHSSNITNNQVDLYKGKKTKTLNI